MIDDDIDFPDSHLPDDAPYVGEIKSTTEFQDTSKFPLHVEAQPQKVTEDDLTPYDLKPLDKKVLISEMADYDMYLKNIHKGFKHITSTRSLIHLVAAGINVHKHRRQVLKDIKGENKAKTLEFDEHGNLKT